MVSPVLKNQLIVHPETHTIVGIGQEGVGPVFIGLDRAAPSDREKVNVDARVR